VRPIQVIYGPKEEAEEEEEDLLHVFLFVILSDSIRFFTGMSGREPEVLHPGYRSIFCNIKYMFYLAESALSKLLLLNR
jgi:hypothetical protein